MIERRLQEGLSNREITRTFIYYWIYQGHLSVGQGALLYPRKVTTKKRIANPHFKPVGPSIDVRSGERAINDCNLDIMRLILLFKPELKMLAYWH